MKANAGEKGKERRRRRRRKSEREERCTPLRSKARPHCEDCTIEYCMEYAQTKQKQSAAKI